MPATRWVMASAASCPTPRATAATGASNRSARAAGRVIGNRARGDRRDIAVVGGDGDGKGDDGDGVGGGGEGGVQAHGDGNGLVGFGCAVIRDAEGSDACAEFGCVKYLRSELGVSATEGRDIVVDTERGGAGRAAGVSPQDAGSDAAQSDGEVDAVAFAGAAVGAGGAAVDAGGDGEGAGGLRVRWWRGGEW